MYISFVLLLLLPYSCEGTIYYVAPDGDNSDGLSWDTAFNRRQWDRHRRIAHWTFPIWLYVSVTGVVVYLMLYRWG